MLALHRSGAVRWSFIGLGLLTGVATIQLIVGLALGRQIRGLDAILPAAAALVPFLVLQSIFAIGEELGWRGWLVTQSKHLPFWAIAAISSAAWTLWHIPAVMLFPFTTAEATAYLISIAATAPLLVALRLASGSIWPAVVVHGGVNSLLVSAGAWVSLRR